MAGIEVSPINEEEAVQENAGGASRAAASDPRQRVSSAADATVAGVKNRG